MKKLSYAKQLEADRLEAIRLGEENETAEYTLTLVAKSGVILSQQTGLCWKDQPVGPIPVGAAGRYFHRTAHDIRPLLAAASKVKRKVLKKSLFVYGCTEAQREKLQQQFAVDPEVTCETLPE